MEQSGKPPKGVGEIRSKLKSVHAGNPPRNVGPKSDGLAESDSLLLTAFYDLDVCRLFQKALARDGIPSRVRQQTQRNELYVDFEDRSRANEVLEAFRKEHEDKRPPRIRTDYDYLLFGAATGGMMGFVMVIMALQGFLDIVRVGIFAAVGGMAGHLADRIRMRYRKHGRLRLGLWEFCLLMTIPALVLVLYRLIPKVVFR